MSSLTNPQIPAFNTVEQLTAYCGLLMARINPSIAFLETENTSIKACQVTIGRAADNTELLIVRVAIPLTANWDSDSTKPIWQAVGVVSDTAVPASYKAA